jgi:hypothetical protein
VADFRLQARNLLILVFAIDIDIEKLATDLKD